MTTAIKMKAEWGVTEWQVAFWADIGIKWEVEAYEYRGEETLSRGSSQFKGPERMRNATEGNVASAASALVLLK